MQNIKVIDTCLQLHNFITDFYCWHSYSVSNDNIIFNEDCRQFFLLDSYSGVCGVEEDSWQNKDGPVFCWGRPLTYDKQCTACGKSIRENLSNTIAGRQLQQNEIIGIVTITTSYNYLKIIYLKSSYLHSIISYSVSSNSTLLSSESLLDFFMSLVLLSITLLQPLDDILFNFSTYLDNAIQSVPMMSSLLTISLLYFCAFLGFDISIAFLRFFLRLSTSF